MSDAAAEFEKLKTMHPDAVLLKEGGVPLALLSKFKFRAGGKEHVMDVLLCPAQQGGYATRLFLERKVEGIALKKPNWTSQRILEREWSVLWWKDVPASLPWTAILCAHLRALA